MQVTIGPNNLAAGGYALSHRRAQGAGSQTPHSRHGLSSSRSSMVARAAAAPSLCAEVAPELSAFNRVYAAGLHAYRAYLNGLDAIVANSPPAERQALEASFLAREQAPFLDYMERGLATLSGHSRTLTGEVRAAYGADLRRHLRPFIDSSEFLTRVLDKPRGYAGDSEMMQMLYKNEMVGDSLFGKLMNHYPMNVPAAQAVRNRRELISDLLQDAVAQKDRVRLMSVACGPAYELADLFRSAQDFESYSMVLLDQDGEALDEAAASMNRVAASFGARAQTSYVTQNVINLIRPTVRESLGTFDFIYSMGLFDYLSQPIAEKLAKSMHSMLKPGGTLVIGNYWNENPSRQYMEMWSDWNLIHRSKSDMQALLANVPDANYSVAPEKSGAQIFLRSVRNP